MEVGRCRGAQATVKCRIILLAVPVILMRARMVVSSATVFPEHSSRATPTQPQRTSSNLSPSCSASPSQSSARPPRKRRESTAMAAECQPED